MRRFRSYPTIAIASLLTIVAVGLFTIIASEKASGQTDSDALHQGREIVERYMAESGVPGLSVAVQVRDSLVWVEGFGLSDVEHNVPVQVDTRFRAGSISKALTSAAVGLLYEQDLLDLDAPIQAYVPSFPEKAYPITARHLGGHLSGLPHYQEDDYVNVVHYESIIAALDKFKDRPLLFEPGERHHYSSFGYNLLSAVVESAAGSPFLDYMDEAVFTPLGMEHTEADRYEAIIPNRTGFYEVTDEGELRHASYTDNSDVWAGGGFLSTPKDLVAFGSGLIDDAFLRPETLDLLFSPMSTNGGGMTNYGLGWRLQEVSGHQGVGHSGGHFGATSLLLMFPDAEVVVAVMTNAFHGPFYPMVYELTALFLP